MAGKHDSGDRPAPRVRGMLGGGTADAFPVFGTYQAPGDRSDISTFTHDDAAAVLDGDEGPVEIRRIASLVRAGRWIGPLPHGGHRHGTGWGKSEFPAGWGEAEVTDWVSALVDTPTGITPSDIDSGFLVTGQYRQVRGVVVVRRSSALRFFVATCYPERYDPSHGFSRVR